MSLLTSLLKSFRCATVALLAGGVVAVLVAGSNQGRAASPSASVGPAHGQAWTLPGVNLDMVPIQAGSFTMGGSPKEVDRSADETQHRVTFTKPFWLGKYPVTQGQWESVMGNNPSMFKDLGKDAPVECVSWDDAMAFCDKLTAREREAGRLPAGYRYTLPTESQWEYACRAGTVTAFYAGGYVTTAQANYDGTFSYNRAPRGSYRQKTTKAGSFAPNAWGLYDMHGNVYEWCSDWYGDYPAGDVADPVGQASGVFRVMRGGCWDDYAAYCRSADRACFGQDGRSSGTGFRLALSPAGK